MEIEMWDIIATIGLVLGIISSLIAITAFIKAKKVESKIGPAKEWKIELLITRPMDGSELKGHLCDLSGRVEFLTSALQYDGNPRINLFLEENKVDIFPIVQPLAEGTYWWVQPKPLIHQNGEFDGSIFIGDNKGNGIGIVFHIAVVAVPKGTIKKGDKLKEAPFSYASSTIVKATRLS